MDITSKSGFPAFASQSGRVHRRVSRASIVISRGFEAKAIGVPMGIPWFQLKEQAKRHGIIAKSSNYTLYANMSNRVVEILQQFACSMEVYSCDESFLSLPKEPIEGLTQYGLKIRKRIQDWLGLTVCVGFGFTKTSAKLANHCAKKNLAGAGGVCDFTTMSEADLQSLFATIEVGEVWGIGRKNAPRLEEMGIKTVEQLRQANRDLIRNRFSVVMERTVRELRGVSCIELEEIAPPKQQIMSSRSFGQYVYDLAELAQAVAAYITTAAEKLRAQGSLAGAVQVYIRTNPNKPKEPQYQRAVTVPLPQPTDDTRVLTRWAFRVLKHIYRPGYAYQKAGICLCDLRDTIQTQQGLFDAPSERSQVLMATMDQINAKWGRGTLQTSAVVAGQNQGWQMKRGNLSPGYTTNWDELAVALAR